MDLESLWDDLSVGRIEQYLAEGDVNRRSSRGGETLLHIAVRCQRADLVAFLIERGADLDAAEDRGWTPLHVAVDAGLEGAGACADGDEEVSLELARALIRAGAREEVGAGDGATPRDLAAARGPAALALYDRISRLDASGEPTLEDFFERCSAVLKIAGLQVADAGGGQLGVGATALEAADPARRLLVPTRWLYRRRREAGFPEALVAEVREGLARQQKQRGAK